jgi:hypothetical protein
VTLAPRSRLILVFIQRSRVRVRSELTDSHVGSGINAGIGTIVTIAGFADC